MAEGTRFIELGSRSDRARVDQIDSEYSVSSLKIASTLTQAEATLMMVMLWILVAPPSFFISYAHYSSGLMVTAALHFALAAVATIAIVVGYLTDKLALGIKLGLVCVWLITYCIVVVDGGLISYSMTWIVILGPITILCGAPVLGRWLTGLGFVMIASLGVVPNSVAG